MPVFLRHDRDGSYYQYGRNGGKYYFDPKDDLSRKRARQRAIDQMYAVEKSRKQVEEIDIVENDDVEWIETNAGSNKWIQKAIKHPGALREQLGVKEGETIPIKKLNKAISKGKKEDATKADKLLAKRAQLAKTLRNL